MWHILLMPMLHYFWFGTRNLKKIITRHKAQYWCFIILVLALCWGYQVAEITWVLENIWQNYENTARVRIHYSCEWFAFMVALLLLLLCYSQDVDRCLVEALCFFSSLSNRGISAGLDSVLVYYWSNWSKHIYIHNCSLLHFHNWK